MQKVLRWMLTALAVAAVPSLASAQVVPEMLPYQGFLADQNAQPIDGSVNLTFSIYESSDAADAVWQETLQNVPVEAGYFAVDLGRIAPLVAAVVEGRTRYIGISVNGDAEATPRQVIGSVPYALLAGDAALLGGQPAAVFITVDRLNQEFNNRNYVNEARVAQLIAEAVLGGGEGGLDAAAVNALIDARGYLDEVEINALINALIDARGYTDEAAVNALIDARNYVNADGVNALIDARNYLNRADIEALIDARVAVQINNLRQELVAQIAAAGPYILGRSAQTSSGRMSFGGVNGLMAANNMCTATYADEATAHLCTFGEVQRALAGSHFNAANNFNGVTTWTVGEVALGSFNGSRRNSCFNLMYNSGDAATGSQLTVRLNDTSDGGGGGLQGHTFDLLQNRACANELPVLCCR